MLVAFFKREGIQMFRITCMIIAAVTAVYGAGYLLLPGQLAALYLPETQINEGTLLLGRYFGLTLLFIAVACWCLKDAVDAKVQNAISTAGLVNGAAGLVVSVVFTLSGLMTILGWSAIAIYLIGIILWLMARKQAQ